VLLEPREKRKVREFKEKKEYYNKIQLITDIPVKNLLPYADMATKEKSTAYLGKELYPYF